ncbi:unnamed protein product [Periconia digitata]|uniref:Uncharacterized protein n=1 Tax=Periconia digitata TaxID=1303443 RepID=A0A9W4U5R4_9PLEO|nr:unnamed protein product [Periconia digitata]
MDPSRYRKAYEAMMHASRLLENKFKPGYHPDGAEADQSSGANGAAFPQDDPDSMEWTPTGATTPTTGCGPPPTASKHMRRLLPETQNGEKELGDSEDNSVLLHKLQEGIMMDQCVDQLVRELPEVLSYENSATFTPSTIEVPKDFSLQLSISINHHLAQIADRKVLEKYRRLLGHHRKDPAKRKAVKLGFDPIELIKRQAVSFPPDAPVRKSTLDNEIHPIFRADNFQGCSDDIYRVLEPALRLSTQLLLSRSTATFWHTLVFGERKPCEATSEAYRQPCYRIRKDVAWSEDNATSFRNFIDRQIDTVHFVFHRHPLPDPAYASMGLVRDFKTGLIRKMDQKCHTSRICLHSDFYTTAKKLSLLQYPDPAMVLRFNLFLAVCLAHEMAHFIEVSGPHHEHPLGEPEVFFNDNTWTESGIAFELKIFGGRLHPISSRVDCGLGLAVLSYPLRELYDKEDNVLYTLPMDYVTNIQQKETWDQDFSSLPIDLFHVPRTGCRSIEINGTNLMVWEDEKDADISDHIDGRDTTFHRMDDGQIVKNPNSNNRKPQRQPEVRRWSPYGHKRTKTADTDSVAEPAATGGDTGKAVQPPETPETSEQGHETGVEGKKVREDDEMTEEQVSDG